MCVDGLHGVHIMTEAGWTSEKPTAAGWYWWRRDQHALPGVAIVCSDLSGYYMSRTGHNSTFDHVDDVIGEWRGPISPDDNAQGRVAGLLQAAEIVPMARGGDSVDGNAAIKLLQAEHARAVSIVKRAKALQLHGLRDTDTNEFLEGYEAACVDILAALSKGRA